MPRVFVYGTLLRGEANHYLLSESRFLCEAETVPAYSLFNLGGFPAMCSGGCTSVAGEVFEVSGEVLDILDELEEHPDWYARTPIRLSGGMSAETYLMDPKRVRGRPLIQSGNWRQKAVVKEPCRP
ncbi:MAG: gamma-glutamylcyclotransferase family protein [Pseudomonadota bacterium]